EVHHLFGEGGGARVAEEYGVELLGTFPLDPGIRESTDAGSPTVAADPSGRVSGLYVDCARRAAGALWRQSAVVAPPPSITMDDK
ncbi:MAG: Mrp/NBP35 family ATP-binding protein, partial [Gammaproteobacteria bacterium]|nr:Mrp/NBP35 family ATP-binding protein [Gammaproteobacteria bacterium]